MSRRDDNLFSSGSIITLKFVAHKLAAATLPLFFVLISGFVYSQQTEIISRNPSNYQGGIVPPEGIAKTDPTYVIVLPPAMSGVGYSFSIPIVDGFNRTDVTFNFTSSTACSGGEISFTPEGSILMNSASTCIPKSSNYIEINLKVTSNTGIDNQKFWLPVLSDPAKIVFVLDNSGSMAMPIPGSSANRWQVLKNSVELFVNKLEFFQQDRESVGITYFSSEVEQPGTPIFDGFIPVTSESASLTSATFSADMKNKTTANRTSMGNALVNAKQKLDNNISFNVRKQVLLVSDGIQNIEPLVNIDGSTLSQSGFKLNNGPCSVTDSIKYFTIGFGASGSASEILAKIADANGGASLIASTDKVDVDIEESFQDQFINMENGGGPQIVSRKSGLLSSPSVSYTFDINRKVSKLYFEFINDYSKDITLKLEKDGKDLTSLANQTNKSFYKTLGLTFPVLSTESIYSQGEWKLTISGKSTNKYSLTCFVDDNFTNFECKPNKSVYTVGDELELSAKVYYGGKAVKNDENKVEVIILKPGDDIGNLLAIYSDTRKDSIVDVDNAAQAKFIHLIQNDNAFIKDLLPESQIVTLSPDTSGLYTGSFKSTKLAGVYKLIYRVNGEIPLYGKVERQKQHTVVFRFGKIDKKASKLEVSIANSGSTKTATINLKPKNKFGYLLGPGFLPRIQIMMDSKQGELKNGKDNLDGSYTFIVSNIPNSVRPDVKIFVMGEMLYQGGIPPTPSIPIWHFVVLIAIIIVLIFGYINTHVGRSWWRIILWILLLINILLMVFQRLGFFQ